MLIKVHSQATPTPAQEAVSGSRGLAQNAVDIS